jgi:hypothetical protein
MSEVPTRRPESSGLFDEQLRHHMDGKERPMNRKPAPMSKGASPTPQAPVKVLQKGGHAAPPQAKFSTVSIASMI